MVRTIAVAAKPGPVQVMASHLHAQGVVPLLVSWFALLAIGTVMIGSASIALGGDYLTKHLLFLAVSGVGAALVFGYSHGLLGQALPARLAGAGHPGGAGVDPVHRPRSEWRLPLDTPGWIFPAGG